MTIYVPEIIGSLWFASEMCVHLTKRTKAGTPSKDRHSLKLIWLVNLAACALGIGAAFKLRECQLPWPQFFQGLGVALFIFGLALRWYSIIQLGRFFTVTVATTTDQHVVDTGPYRYVRHPSYTGAQLSAFGFALTFQNWATLLFIFLPSIAVQMWRIHIEEKALLAGLGEPYRKYMQRTKRLIPWVY